MKIKFLLPIFITLIVAYNTQAAPVSIDKASVVAVNFYYHAVNQLKETEYNSIKIKNSYQETENGILFYYIFNIDDGGFIIISADDAFYPILGYSFEGNIDDKEPSPEFKYWMDGYKEQIRYAVCNNLSGNLKSKQLWNEYSTLKKYKKNEDDLTVGPLLLTRWNQGVPYNELCPLDPAGPGGHVYAGCVATAMAQLMNYYKFPLQGTHYNCYTSNYGYLCSTFSDSLYKWNEMPNKITSSCIPIASLLYQIGISVNMNYKPTGSSAPNTAVPAALQIYFGYNHQSELVARNNYSQSAWEALIQNMLNGKNPIYYSGFVPPGGGSGHAFVCDGYQIVGSTTSYHFNWGWGGNYDGYFSINNLNPGGSNYNANQVMIINSFPESNYPYYCSGIQTLKAINGVFEDGSGHNDYLSNNNCSWLIAPSNPSGTDHISIQFDLFQVSDPDDIITIYNGDNIAAPILATFKGDQPPTIGEFINSTSDTVLVRFTSNESNNGGGWHISYFSKSKTHCQEMSTFLQSYHSFDDGSGPQYNYSNNTACAWKINPDNATFVKLKFNELYTESNKDLIYIYNAFIAVQDSLIGIYSGNTIPDTILSNTGKMFIVFVSDGSRNYPGWSVSYISNGTSGANIPETENLLDLNVFPNPTENQVTFTFSVHTSQLIMISLTDILGKPVYNISFKSISGTNSLYLDFSNQKKGIYILCLQTKESVYYEKLILK